MKSKMNITTPRRNLMTRRIVHSRSTTAPRREKSCWNWLSRTRFPTAKSVEVVSRRRRKTTTMMMMINGTDVS